MARRSGFTLVEVLLVLAMLALFATLLIPGANSILREINARGPEQMLSETVLAARAMALETGRIVELRYDAEERLFTNAAGEAQGEALPADCKLTLLPPAVDGNILLGGQLVETGELRRVRFFPDGTCDPFRVRWQEGEGPARLLLADPWTCALSPVVAKR